MHHGPRGERLNLVVFLSFFHKMPCGASQSQHVPTTFLYEDIPFISWKIPECWRGHRSGVADCCRHRIASRASLTVVFARWVPLFRKTGFFIWQLKKLDFGQNIRNPNTMFRYRPWLLVAAMVAGSVALRKFAVGPDSPRCPVVGLAHHHIPWWQIIKNVTTEAISHDLVRVVDLAASTEDEETNAFAYQMHVPNGSLQTWWTPWVAPRCPVVHCPFSKKPLFFDIKTVYKWPNDLVGQLDRIAKAPSGADTRFRWTAAVLIAVQCL